MVKRKVATGKKSPSQTDGSRVVTRAGSSNAATRSKDEGVARVEETGVCHISFDSCYGERFNAP